MAVSAHMGPMTTARTISTGAEWDALPIGTLARVGYLGDDEDENDHDGIMSILRVEGDVRANAGDCMLAGGKYWAEVWVWQQGVTVMDPATLPEPEFEAAPDPELTDAVAAVDAAIEDHARRVKALNATPIADYWKIPLEAHPAPTPARDIIKALSALGWAPPSVYPDGVQVWTISGIPNGGVGDGTQAYLSLPAGSTDKQLRSDIWLKHPTVTVNFELPPKPFN